jgi:exodeoxyribonuclease-1
VAEEKLNGQDTPHSAHGNGSAEAGECSTPINLSDFMMTGRDLLSRNSSRKSRREDEIRQDLVHQRLFFYSIETFSREKSGPIAEFSWLTADEDLNELEGRSGRFLMAIPPDVLPDPVCAAAAGISPSEAQRTGLRENEFAEKILSVLPKGAFCRIGWNNVGFTDERIRALLFRTFHEPYLSGRDGFERTRFDLLTCTRTVFTLRPGIIAEPQGKNILSLTEVSKANGIETAFKPRMMLELMRLFREKLPKMLSFYMSLRTKAAMSEYLKRQSLRWIQIVTAATWGEKLSAIPAMPLGPILGKGPDSGRWLMLSLAGEPSECIMNPALLEGEADTSDEEILDTGDSGSDDSASSSGDSEVKGSEALLPKSYGLEKYGLFLLSPNRCPAVAPIATLSEERAKELGISAKKAQANYQAYRKDWGTSISAIKLILKKALAERNRMMKDRFRNLPPEEKLYEGFIPDSDRELEKELHLVQQSDPLEVRDFRFSDGRLNVMLFTYIGRNLPETMTEEELAEWKRLCDERIEKQLPAFRKRCGEALQRFSGNENAMAILKEFDIQN